MKRIVIGDNPHLETFLKSLYKEETEQSIKRLAIRLNRPLVETRQFVENYDKPLWYIHYRLDSGISLGKGFPPYGKKPIEQCTLEECSER